MNDSSRVRRSSVVASYPNSIAGSVQRGQAAVGRQHQPDRRLAGLQARLGERTGGVQHDELAERAAVRLLQTRFAERALLALGRPGEHGIRAGALRREVLQGLEAVLVSEFLGDREGVLVGRL